MVWTGYGEIDCGCVSGCSMDEKIVEIASANGPATLGDKGSKTIAYVRFDTNPGIFTRKERGCRSKFGVLIVADNDVNVPKDGRPVAGVKDAGGAFPRQSAAGGIRVEGVAVDFRDVDNRPRRIAPFIIGRNDI